MRIRSACIMLAVTLVTAALGAGSAAATGPLSGTKIRNWPTGFVLGVAGNSTVGGAQIQYQQDSDSLAQKWAIDPVTSTTFLLRNLNSDMCVTVQEVGDAAALQQRPCDARWDEQIFSLADSNKPNRYLIKNPAAARCLNPQTVGAGTTVLALACNAGNNYQWNSFDVR